jgi:sugar phosphate isomerase/epimerase
MKLGLQLFSVKKALASDPVKTIRAVAEMGYHYLEPIVPGVEPDTAREFGVPKDELLRVLDETGAKLVSIHFNNLNFEKAAQIMDFYASLGIRYIMAGSGAVNMDPTREEILEEAESLNALGKQAKTAGLQLMYHNHFYEFKTWDGGGNGWDLLLSNCDPALVKIQLDTYWAIRGGGDPIAIMKKYGKRVCILHQKDYPRGFEDQINVNELFKKAGIPPTFEALIGPKGVLDMRTFTEIGTGILPIQSYIDCANENCAVDYILVEQDMSQIGEMESAKVSMEAFKKLKGIE